MDMFDYLRNGKMNDLEEAFTGNATVADFITNGVAQAFTGMLGMRKKVDDTIAAKFSNTSIFTLRGGIYQLVRSDPAIVTVANWSVGRPLFWVDKTLFKVTTVVADATVEYAGQAIGGLTTAGKIKIMQIQGEAPGLYAAALTKAAPALNDPIILKFAANLADLDVALDATAWDNTVVKRVIGNVDEAAVAASVKRFYLSGAHINMNRGIM